MVARIVRDNQKYAAHHVLCDETIAQADALRRRALAARADDESAFGGVVTAMALPKATPEEKAARTATLQAALANAAAAPLDAAEIAKLVAVHAERALAFGNVNLLSDLGTAAEFAQAAFASAANNVRANHAYMKDRATIDRQASELDRYERELAPLVARVRYEVSRSFATV